MIARAIPVPSRIGNAAEGTVVEVRIALDGQDAVESLPMNRLLRQVVPAGGSRSVSTSSCCGYAEPHARPR